MPLKLLLISVEGTIAGANNKVNTQIIGDLAKLANQLMKRGVDVALWSNRSWTFNGTPLHEHMSALAGAPIVAHGFHVDGMAARRMGNSVQGILAAHGVNSYETILLGGTEEDMLAGVNNRLLHVRSDWYGQHTDYGFKVASVAELARFCFVFALRAHPIFWQINDGTLNASAAGPFSTIVEAYAPFGHDSKSAAKVGAGHPEFWFYLAVSSLYFSGLLAEVNYICSYPGHNSKSKPIKTNGLEATLSRLGKCFNISYYHDLIVRHTSAPKSQPIKAADRRFVPQLNSIHLQRRPHRNLSDEANKSPLSLAGKTVLVVDDICTSGHSLEAARAYIEQAGGKVRLYSWLKTINVPYIRLTGKVELRPYESNHVTNEPKSTAYKYGSAIVDPLAPHEISTIFDMFRRWDWSKIV